MAKGPGKNNRIGMTLKQLFELFPTEEAAEAWFAKLLWNDEPFCPHCGSYNVQAGIKHPQMTHRCRDCPKRRMFTLKTGTVMAGSPLSYRTWALAIYLVTTNLKGVASMKLHRELGICQKSAWFLAHRLREAWKAPQKLKFSGPVEVDETFIGGFRKNMSLKKRKEMKGTGPHSGKVIVAGVKDRETNRVSAAVIQDTTYDALQAFIDERVKRTATVYTDDFNGYLGLKNPHETVNHSAHEYVRDGIGTQGIESAWSMMKRGHKGTYHKMSPKHMDRYVSEFSGRHNIREMHTLSQMALVVFRLENKRLKYKDLTADNGLSSGARS